ncbi:MAG: hypothetical protein F6J97_09495 [Leptolyngbya sp. SIO4C1]|nr:hypothetical protein [Leptolyngbya sp. SIO4C1]
MVRLANLNLTAQPALSLVDDIQLALAIATETDLKSLLCGCTPALIAPKQVDHAEIQVGLPLAETTLDGLIRFEQVHCLLAGKAPVQPIGNPRYQNYPDLTLYHSGLQTLAERVCPQTALAILTHVGYSAEQAQAILHLPSQAWHKTWWWQLDSLGQLSEPFYRWMRLRGHPSGTLTLQYQDYYPETCPPCFYSEIQQVSVMVRSQTDSFANTLAMLNRARAGFNTSLAILITPPLSDLETEGFIRQQVSLYVLNSQRS